MTSTKKLPVKTLVKNGKPVLTIKDVLDAAKLGQSELTSAFMAFLEQTVDLVNAHVDDIHAMNIIALHNAFDNSNSFNLMTQMVNYVTQMRAVRHARLKQWFTENAPVIWEKDKFVFDSSRTNEAYRLEYAQANPWHEKAELTSENFYSLENIRKTVETAINRANGKKANPHQIAKLKETAKMLENLLPVIDKAIKDAALNDEVIDVTPPQANAA